MLLAGGLRSYCSPIDDASVDLRPNRGIARFLEFRFDLLEYLFALLSRLDTVVFKGLDDSRRNTGCLER